MRVVQTCLHDYYVSIAKGEENLITCVLGAFMGGITIEEKKCNMCFANDM